MNKKYTIIWALTVGTFGLAVSSLTEITPTSSGFVPGTQAVQVSPAVLFVAQVPTKLDVNTTTTTFNNHLGGVQNVARGGDLYIRYGDGTLKNLTASAGFGAPSGFQGGSSIAVRDPSMHWDGNKALFSMVIGAPVTAGQTISPVWQLFEVSGFASLTETVLITKVANQPNSFNNVSPLYGTDDRIIFTSDRPWRGAQQPYPLLDEYNMRPTNSGLWSLDPVANDLRLLDASPSGDFAPTIDSFGRLIFVRWDHLERDQEHDSDFKSTGQPFGGNCFFCTFNYAGETITASTLLTNAESYPEPRPNTAWLSGTNLAGHHMNEFIPWTIGEDGTAAETLNHIGRHELLAAIPAALTNDAALHPLLPATMFNKSRIKWYIQMKEDPAHVGTYFGVNLLELTHASGQIVSMTAPFTPFLSADQIELGYVTHSETMSTSGALLNSTGHYRDPLPMSDGTLIAAHTTVTGFESPIPPATNWLYSGFAFRLTSLKIGAAGVMVPDQVLTPGISKTISFWYSPTLLLAYSGNLWELQPVEVRARSRPAKIISPPTKSPELAAFAAAGVLPADVQAWMSQNNLGLATVRNVTTRDDADIQQPYNLRVGVPGGVQTIANPGTVYTVTTLQVYEADLLRGLGGTPAPQPGRRVLAQTLQDPQALLANPPSAGPPGSFALAADGSAAAFVPALRPVTWQLLDPAGTPVVRERFWLTFQPGEVRMCTSCHGLNTTDQAGGTAPQNSPQALVDLLIQWKLKTATLASVTPTPTPTGSSTYAPTTTSTPSGIPTPSVTATPTPTTTATQSSTPAHALGSPSATTLPGTGTLTQTPTPTPTISPTSTALNPSAKPRNFLSIVIA